MVEKSLPARIGGILGHSFAILLYVIVAYSVGRHQGSDEGQRRGVDGVMCAMDRLANSKPVGTLGKSEYCQRIYGMERSK